METGHPMKIKKYLLSCGMCILTSDQYIRLCTLDDFPVFKFGGRFDEGHIVWDSFSDRSFSYDPLNAVDWFESTFPWVHVLRLYLTILL